MDYDQIITMPGSAHSKVPYDLNLSSTLPLTTVPPWTRLSYELQSHFVEDGIKYYLLGYCENLAQ